MTLDSLRNLLGFSKQPSSALSEIEQIDQELIELRALKDSTQARLRSLVARRDALVAKESAAAKLAQMTPAERRALGIPESQSIANVGGIKSTETFR
jgi:hypothetical protein